MTAVNDTAAHGGLDAVFELERALEDRDDARGAADAAVDNAREEAERLLAEARASGTETGRRRHAALIADAEADAEAIRVAGEAAAQELLERVSSERDELIARLTTLLLPLEG